MSPGPRVTAMPRRSPSATPAWSSAARIAGVPVKLTKLAAYVISGLMALTLSPALAAIIIKAHHGEKKGFFRWFNNSFDRLNHSYVGGVARMVQRWPLALLAFGARWQRAVPLPLGKTMSRLPLPESDPAVAEDRVPIAVVGAHMSGFSPFTAMILLVLVFYFTHYLFASVTAHVTALLPVMLAVGATIPGIDIPLFALASLHSHRIIMLPGSSVPTPGPHPGSPPRVGRHGRASAASNLNPGSPAPPRTRLCRARDSLSGPGCRTESRPDDLLPDTAGEGRRRPGPRAPARAATPTFESRYEVIAKLTYMFDSEGR
jgi:hypothetical protein